MKKLMLQLMALLAAPSIMHAQPIVSSLSSYNGVPGSAVTITGSGFNTTGSNNIVFFGATRATVSSASSSALNVTVPFGATYAAPTVRNAATNLVGTSPKAFLQTYDDSPYRNDTVRFDAPLRLYLPENAGDIQLSDLDGDGKADIIATHWANGLSIIRNTSEQGYLSAASVAPIVSLPLSETPGLMAIEDMNGDGKPDIIVSVPGSNGLINGTVSIYLNNCTPGSITASSFSARIDMPITRACTYLVVRDIDGDGKPDIVCASDFKMTILRNTMTGSTVSPSDFVSRTDFDVRCYGNLDISDLDGDNKPEIVIGGPGEIYVFKNNCTPGTINRQSLVKSFTRAAVPAQVKDIRVLDADGDGKPDIAYVAGSYSTNGLTVMRNMTSGPGISSSSFAANMTFPLDTVPTRMATGDINGDGKPDIAITNELGGLVVALNTTTPSAGISFSPVWTRETAQFPGPIVISDIDGDRLPDIITGAAPETYATPGMIFRNNSMCLHPVTGSATVCVGATTTLSGAAGGGTWSSGNTAVATIGAATGIVTGIAAGTVTLTYNAGSATAFHRMIVIAAPAAITGPANACPGSPTTLSDAIAGGTWSSSTTGVATIDSNGKLIGLTVGTTTVSYTNVCGTATQDLTVNPLPAAITGTTAVSAGGTSTLANVTPGGTWLSADITVASADATTGIVTATAAGMTMISYQLSTGCRSTVLFTVNALTIAPPVITSLSAITDTPGSTLVINGSNFNSTTNNNIVWFGGTKATVTAASPTSLTVTVPLGANYAPVSVTNRSSALTGKSNLAFIPKYNNTGNLNITDFDPAADHGSANTLETMAESDMDGDGKTDIVTAIGHSICIYKNTSTSGSLAPGAFAEAVCFYNPAGEGNPDQKGFHLVDMDGDGKKDVVAIFTGTISTFSVSRNTSIPGTLSFAPAVYYPAGYNAEDLEVADFNNDGKPDIAVANVYANTFSVYRNLSVCGTIDSTSFAPGIVFTTNAYPGSVTAGDIDGDGKPEIMVGNGTTISIYRNTSATSTITFATKVDITNNEAMYGRMLLADVDGDGKSDLLTTKMNSRKFSVFRNVSTPGSITASSLSTAVNFDGMYYYDIWGRIADINGDGKPDVVTGNVLDNALHIFKNNATAGTINTSSFSPKITFPQLGQNMIVADFDGDKMPDIAATNGRLTALRQRAVKITPASMLCAGVTKTLSDITAGGTWSSSNTAVATIGSTNGVATGVGAGRVIITYTKPGGSIDTTSILVRTAPGAITGPGNVCSQVDTFVFTNPVPGGTWSTSNFFLSVDAMGYAATSDTNGNVIVTYSTGCLPNATKPVIVGRTPRNITGITSIYQGSVTTLGNTIPGSWSSSNTAVATIGSTTGIYTGLSAGTTTITYSHSSGCLVKSVVTVNPPIAMPRVTSVTPSIAAPGTSVTITGSGFDAASANNIVYFGATQATITSASTGTLTATVPVGATYLPVSVYNTGLQLSGESKYSFLPTFDNSGSTAGTISFDPKVFFATSTRPEKVAVGDLDGDGKAEIVVAYFGPDFISIFKNVAIPGVITSSSLATRLDLPSGTNALGLAIRDIDGDGKPDIVMSGDGKLSIYRNNATPGTLTASSFDARVDFPVSDYSLGRLATADLDQDGKYDIISSFGTGIRIWRNAATPGSIDANSLISYYVDAGTGANFNDIAVADIDGDGKEDIIGSFWQGTVFIFRNKTIPGWINSFSPFAPAVPYAVTYGTTGLAVSDVDGDGKKDILTVAVVGGGSTSVLRNISTPGSITTSSMEAAVTLSTQGGQGMAMGDLDGNGKPDMIVGYGPAYVHRNIASSGSISASSFAPRISLSVSGMTNGAMNIAIGDIDGDGRPDIVTANDLGNNIAVLRNNASPSIVGTTTICPGAATTLSHVTTGGTWSSSNPAVAIIGSSSGLVSGLVSGTTTINYVFSGGIATTVLTVTGTPSAGTISGSNTVATGSTVSLTSTIPGGSWSASNSNVTAGSTGTITGVTAGTVAISYTVVNSCGIAGSAAYLMTVTTTPIVGPLSVIGGSTVTLSHAIPGGVWSTPCGDIATVSSTGVVTGISAGLATITYTTGSAFSFAVVTVSAAPSAISGGLVVCAGTSSTLSYPTGGGNWTSSNTSVATTGSTGFTTGVATGTAVISYQYGPGCSSYAIATVNPAPYAGTLSGSWHVNIGTTATISGAAPGGTWSVSNANATVDGSGHVTGVTGGPVTISYTVTNSCGTALATMEMTVSVPAVSPITGILSVCSGGTSTLSSVSTGYTWSSSNAVIASVSTTGVVTAGSPGVATISYTRPDGVYTTAEFTVNPLPAVITGTTSMCQGTATTLSTATTGGAWGSSDPAIAEVSTTGIVTGINAGVATISYVTGLGCPRTTMVTVTASPSIAGSPVVCPGTTTTLTSSVSGGSWTGGSAVVATIGGGGVLTGIAAGTTNISYNMGSGCVAVVTASVNPMPATTTGTMKVCTGTTTTLSNTTTGGNWSSSNTSLATVNTNGVVTGVSAGTVAISYAMASGCARTSIVTVNPDPAAIMGTTVLCAGSSVNLTDASPGLSWTSGNTTVATINPTGMVTGVTEGTAIITYTAASTNCITTTTVTVNALPAAISGSATGCVGATTTLTNTTPGGTWSSSNATVAQIGSATGVVTGSSAGMTMITYTTTAGCRNTKIMTINTTPTVTGYPIACVGKTTTLSGGWGTWSSGAPAIATIATSGGYVNGISAGTAVMTFTGSVPNCPATIVVTVIPTPGAITGPIQACSGETATLSNASAGGVWSSANTAMATIGSATGIVSGVGSGGNVTISYAFSNNCVTTMTFKVKPIPAVIGGTYSVCATMATTLSDVTSNGTWSSSNTSVATVGTGISAGYGAVTGVSAGTANISYTLTLTGCARIAQVTVDPCSRPGGNTQSAGGIAQLYPNPTNGSFTVVAEGSGLLHVYTVDGRSVTTYSIRGGINNLDLPPTLATGVYMCRFSDEQGNTTMVRLVYER